MIMEKTLSVELIPVGWGPVDANLEESHSCAAVALRNAIDWKKSIRDQVGCS